MDAKQLQSIVERTERENAQRNMAQRAQELQTKRLKSPWGRNDFNSWYLSKLFKQMTQLINTIVLARDVMKETTKGQEMKQNDILQVIIKDLHEAKNRLQALCFELTVPVAVDLVIKVNEVVNLTINAYSDGCKGTEPKTSEFNLNELIKELDEAEKRITNPDDKMEVKDK
eukprot:UN32441